MLAAVLMLVSLSQSVVLVSITPRLLKARNFES